MQLIVRINLSLFSIKRKNLISIVDNAVSVPWQVEPLLPPLPLPPNNTSKEQLYLQKLSLYFVRILAREHRRLKTSGKSI